MHPTLHQTGNGPVRAIVENDWQAGRVGDDWVEIEWLEGPLARPRNWGRYIRDKYPELSGYGDSDLRVDTVCERDGVDRVRLFRRQEPSERAPRKKPRRQ